MITSTAKRRRLDHEYGSQISAVQQVRIANDDGGRAWQQHRLALVVGLALVTVLLALGWHVSSPRWLASGAMTAAVVVQLYGPMVWLQRCGESLDTLGLGDTNMGPSLRSAMLLGCFIIVPWIGFTYLCGWLTPRTPLPPRSAASWLYAAAMQALGVAWPEEVFWRGFVQRVLTSRFPTATRLIPGLSVGAVGATALFASVHLLAAGQWVRLATFFPGLLFALLRQRSNHLAGPILLHTACNLAADLVVRL